MLKYILFHVSFLILGVNFLVFSQKEPLQLAVISLTHTHVHGVFNSEKRGDFEIVGIVEPDLKLAAKYAQQYQFSLGKVYPTMDALLAKIKPEAVSAFGTIYDHLSIVQKFAPLGIHVMVEKPLAVSLKHAKEMQKLAEKYGIHLLTNYETTWYSTHFKALDLLRNGDVGELRKVIVRDGHKGPAILQISKEFLDWLIDPRWNGGGAITDFGCYGANLLSWLRNGERPISVTAVTQQLQADNNPLVDDDATIFLQYRDFNAVLQASWNWPIGRKDMEIHGTTGTIHVKNRSSLNWQTSTGYDSYEEKNFSLPEREYPLDDPFSYFRAVIRKEIVPQPYELCSLENNLLVMEILDAAIKSAKKGKTVSLP